MQPEVTSVDWKERKLTLPQCVHQERYLGLRRQVSIFSTGLFIFGGGGGVISKRV